MHLQFIPINYTPSPILLNMSYCNCLEIYISFHKKCASDIFLSFYAPSEVGFWQFSINFSNWWIITTVIMVWVYKTREKGAVFKVKTIKDLSFAGWSALFYLMLFSFCSLSDSELNYKRGFYPFYKNTDKKPIPIFASNAVKHSKLAGSSYSFGPSVCFSKLMNKLANLCTSAAHQL